MADESNKQPEEKKEQKKESKEAKPAEKTVKASPKLAKLIEEIEKLSVLELAELVKALEDKFGVSAMPVSAPATAGAPAAGGDQPEAGQAAKAKVNVVLTNAGATKIAVIKAVREVNQELGLKEAKDLVEAAPKEVLTDADTKTAEEAKKKLEEAGATVELK